MFKNYIFLNAQVAKKWTTYLFPIIFLLTFSILILAKALQNGTDNTILLRLGFYYYVIPFACAVIFAGMKALNIFQENIETGVELIIVSKPFKRSQIIMAKFFSLYTWFICYMLLTFVIIWSISFIDKPSTILEKFKFAASLSVGSLIIMVLISSIIILTTQIFSTIVSIFISSLIAICPMFTSIIAPILHAQHLNFIGTPHYMVTQKNISKAEVSGDQFFFFNPSDIKTAKILDPDLYKRMKSGYLANKNSGYKYVVYADIYQQLGGFLSLFQEQQWNYESIAYWTEAKRKVHSDYHFTIDGWEYIYMYWNNSRHNNLTASEVYNISKKASAYVMNHKTEPQWIGLSNIDFLNRSNNKDWINLLNSYISQEATVETHFDDNLVKLSLLIAEKENIDFKNFIKIKPITQDLLYFRGLFADGGTVPVYVPHHYLPKIWVLIGWGILILVLGGWVMNIYYKKDFK